MRPGNEHTVQAEKLAHAQEIMIGMLEKVHSILDNAGIRYVLGFGTLLGAVRHKGFIPWDDDMDLFVFEEHYQLALATLQEELADDSDYILQTRESDPQFWLNYANVRHRKSLVIPLIDRALPLKYRGVCISLFPAPLVKKGNFRLWIMARNLTNAKNYNKHVHNPAGFIKWLIASILLLLAKLCFALVELMPAWYFRAFPGWKEIGECYADDDVLPLVQLEFEGGFYPAPRNYDQILADWYGDYMQLPPPDQRRVHLRDIVFQ